MESLRGMGAAFNPAVEGFEVIKTFPDSPAAAAGLEEWDLLTHLDGTPVLERGCIGISDYSGKDSLRLTVRRGESLLEIEVSVEALVP